MSLLESNREYFTPEEVGSYYHVHPETIRRLCRDGKIAGVKQIGRQWRIPRSFIQENQSLDNLDKEEGKQS